ncbi:hypothetical protein XENOCAPTIV_003077, partial [Xenoophorus captivus]
LCSRWCLASCPQPLGPQLDMGRLGGTWCDLDNTQLLSLPTLPRRLLTAFLPPHPNPIDIFSGCFPPPESSFTRLSNYPMQWPSCWSDRTHVTTRPGG